ncbi:MAG: hypothetical protein HY447_01810 [Candidatus Omnitrophica bacterium]|nr:hypothetical protein [Candidatus Omnitrophota bacterium]
MKSSIFIVILITLGFVSIFAIRHWKSIPPSPQTDKPAASSGPVSNLPSPARNRFSLDACRSEIKEVPKPPFAYNQFSPTGGASADYRKDRIAGKNLFKDYVTCALIYTFNEAPEQTYADVGLELYTIDNITGQKVLNYQAGIENFALAVDKAYGEVLTNQGWMRQTRVGGEPLAYGLPTLIFYKKTEGQNRYIDIRVGPKAVTVSLLITAE